MYYVISGLAAVACIVLGTTIKRLREAARRDWIHRFQTDNEVASVPEYRGWQRLSKACIGLGVAILVVGFSIWAWFFGLSQDSLFVRLVVWGALLGLQVAALPASFASVMGERAASLAAGLERVSHYLFVVWGVSTGLLVFVVIFELLSSGSSGGADGPHVVFRPPL